MWSQESRSCMLVCVIIVVFICYSNHAISKTIEIFYHTLDYERSFLGILFTSYSMLTSKV